MKIFFKIGDILQIPNLSDYLSLDNQYFTIVDIIPGGMGYCLKLKNNNIFYAAKTIYGDFFSDNDSKNRFIFELKTWLTLSSLNGIVKAFLVVNINDIPCIISKWMDNSNLRKYLNKKERYLFYNSIIRIAHALDLVNKKYNIIHRDLKPENLLFDKNDKVYIADWGISKVIINHIVSNNLAKISDNLNKDDAGKFIGTIQYASPEQIQGLVNVDLRSDIYSLGCIMYEWETGTMPFIGKTIQEIVTKQLYEKPKEFSNFFKQSNYGIEKIIFKCLEKDPNKRYQTYDSLILDIKNIAKKYNITAFDIIEDDYSIPIIGNNEIKNRLNKIKINAKGYGLIEQSEVDKYFKEALHLIAIGDYSKVIEILRPFFIQSLFKEIPDSPFVQQICINLSLAEKQIGNIETAIEIIRTIDFATIKPAEYYVNLSQYYIMLEMFDLVETFCLEGLERYPNDQDLLGNLTIAFNWQKKFTEAINNAKKRLEISRNLQSLTEIATVYTKIAEEKKNNDFINAIKNYKLAYNFLSEAKDLNPRAIVARYNIANILFKLRKYDDSIKEINEIIDLNNGSVTSTGLFYLARNYLWLGGFEFGLKYIDKFIDKIPENDNMKINILRVRSIICLDGLSSKKDGIIHIDRKSENFFRDIINDKKNRYYYDYEYLAQILTWQNSLDKAIEIIHEGINLFPDYWRFYMSLSSIYLKQNNIDLALKETETALKIAPWRENVHFRLSEIYKIKNDKENYYKHREKGIEYRETKKILYSQSVDEPPDTTVTII